jgi:hypothetical protein
MSTTLVGSLIGFGCLGVVLVAVLAYVKKRYLRRRSDPARKGVVKKGALEMQNLGYA